MITIRGGYMDKLITVIRGMALGLLQGLTEFLPVSSSGHLLLLEKAGFAPQSVTLNLFLHVATLLSIMVGMRKSVIQWIKHPLEKPSVWLYISCIPTVIIAFIFKYFFKEILLGKVLIPCFLITAILLLLPKPNYKNNLNPINATIAGIAQGFAVLPGLSRSGTTIATLRLLGIEEDKSVELSFLMSIPIIIGGFILELKELSSWELDIALLIPAFITAFLSGLLSVKVMTKLFTRKSSLPFSIYLVVLSMVYYFI